MKVNKPAAFQPYTISVQTPDDHDRLVSLIRVYENHGVVNATKKWANELEKEMVQVYRGIMC